MIYLFEVLIILFLFSLFGVIHSILASNKVKFWVTEKYNSKIAFYRIAYNVFSIILLAVIYLISPKPDLVIYDLSFPFDIIIFVLQIFCLVGLIWSLKFVDGKELLGTAQIKRWLNGTYNKNDLDDKSDFRIVGPYKISRHPIYLFSILFLGFRPVMDLFYITMFTTFVAYFYIGSYYEEQRLIEKFGKPYLEYQKKVSRIFPFNFKQLWE